MEHIEFIPKAGACLATRNVIEQKGLVRWMVRGESQVPADNGWQIMSHIDTSDYLNDSSNWQIVDFNDLCAIEVFSPDAFVEGEDDQGCGGDRGDGSGIEGDVREGLEVLDQGVGPLGGSPH